MLSNDCRKKRWRDEVKILTSIKYDKNYYLYIDESGNHQNKSLKKIVEYMNNRDAKFLDGPDEVFSLTGVLINGENIKKLEEKVKGLKVKWFGKTSYKTKPIVIHKKDFGNKSPFRQGENFDKKEFELEYEKILKSIDFKVFSVCVNKLVLYCDGKLDCSNVNKDHNIYNESLHKLLLQVNEYSGIAKSKFIPIFESRSPKDDKKVHEFIMSKNFGFIKAMYFSNKTINNTHVVVGLEVADYFSHSAFRWGLCRDYHRIVTKYNNFPSHYEYGLFMMK